MALARRDLDLLLVFPPMATAVEFPELGMCQLTANLRRSGFSVVQRDLNAGLLHRYLPSRETLQALARGPLALDAAERVAAGDPVSFLEAAFRRGLAEKQGKFVAEPFEGLRDLLTLLRVTGRLVDNMSEAGPLAALRGVLADDGAWAGPELAPMAAFLEECLRRPGLWSTFADGLQEVSLAPRSYRVDDALELVVTPGPARAFFERFYERLVSGFLAGYAPRAVGFSVWTTSQVVPTLLLARVLRAAAPGIRLIAGGPWFTAAAPIFGHAPELVAHFDAIVLYEGERPLASCLQRFREGRDLDGVENLVRLIDGEVRRAPVGPPLPLGEVAPPVFDGIELARYSSYRLPLRLQRGCYWGRCTFCYHVFRSYNNRYRTRKCDELPPGFLDRALDYMEEMGRTYGVDRFALTDHEIPVHAMRSFADGILARGLRVSWEALARFERDYTREACERIVASGCDRLQVGLETSDEAALRRMKKGLRLDTVKRNAALWSETGLRADLFMLAMPEQRPEDLTRSLAFALEELPEVEKLIVQRFCLARNSEIVDAPEAHGIALRTDPDRDLFVHALEYEALRGMSARDYIALGIDEPPGSPRDADPRYGPLRRRLAEASGMPYRIQLAYVPDDLDADAAAGPPERVDRDPAAHLVAPVDAAA